MYGLALYQMMPVHCTIWIMTYCTMWRGRLIYASMKSCPVCHIKGCLGLTSNDSLTCFQFTIRMQRICTQSYTKGKGFYFYSCSSILLPVCLYKNNSRVTFLKNRMDFKTKCNSLAALKLVSDAITVLPSANMDLF